MGSTISAPDFAASSSLLRPLISNQSLKMADKLRTLQNLEALQARYIGTGHADTTKHEWTGNILRDSYASYVGHNPLLSYMAVGMGETKEKARVMWLEKMVRGAGNPPEVCDTHIAYGASRSH